MKIFLPSARGPKAIYEIYNLPAFVRIIYAEGCATRVSPPRSRISSTVGYWNVLNECLEEMPDKERFIWLADDIRPKSGWLKNAIECYEIVFPDGMGLVALNDLLIKDAGCAFGMTTRAWLNVLFGEPFFPSGFAHGFVDTLAADRSKDLGRYFFCWNSVVEHMHHSAKKSEFDEVYKENRRRMNENKDKLKKDAMDREWINGGKEEAERRMENDHS